MQSIEVEAKSLEEAILIACEKLHTSKDKMHVEVLEEPSGKLMSLFSNKKARIRASMMAVSQQSDSDAIDTLKEILETIVSGIYPKASVKIKKEYDETVLNIIGDGSGIFIGKKGQTLEAFQYLINKIRLSKFKNAPHITVDSESYRSRHIASLVSLAKRLSEKAKKRGGPVTTNPLTPGDRRIIHMTLKKDSELTTWSKGDGNLKKVIIAPRQS